MSHSKACLSPDEQPIPLVRYLCAGKNHVNHPYGIPHYFEADQLAFVGMNANGPSGWYCKDCVMAMPGVAYSGRRSLADQMELTALRTRISELGG